MSSDELREKFLEAAGLAGTGKGCPSSGEIWDTVSAEHQHPRFSSILDHIAACPACASTWRLARDLGARAVTADATGALAATKAAGWRWWGVRGAVAAAAVVMLVLAAELFRQAPSEPVLRAPQAPIVRSLLDDKTALPRNDAVLRWSTVGDEATRYSVRVLDQDLRPLASARHLDLPEYLIPAEALAGLPSGEMVLWQVDAILPDGSRQSSDTFLFRIQ